MSAVWGAGVGHEGEGGEDGLATTVGAGEGIHPEQSYRPVNEIVRQSRVTGLQESGEKVLTTLDDDFEPHVTC